MRSVVSDLRHGLRLLVKNPGFSAAAVISLAIGIGSNTAIFSVVSALLLQPLPVERPHELVSVYTSDFSGPPFGTSSYPDFQEFRDKNSVFNGLAAYSSFGATIVFNNRSERAAGTLASGNYFELLGIRPAVGRTFGVQEDTAGADSVTVLSDAFWQRLGAPADVLGQPVTVNGYPLVVIGITPASFTGLRSGRPPDLWVPSTMIGQVLPGASPLTQRSSRRWLLIGRLSPTATLEQAQAAFSVVAGQMALAYPAAWLDVRRQVRRITVTPATRVAPGVRDSVVSFMSLLMAVVGLVLLIACANVANLLLGRAAARRREVAVRLSLGAPRSRLVRQLLTESVLLSLVAGAAGLVLAFWSVRAIQQFRSPVPLPIPLDATLDARVLIFAATLSVVTGLIFGVVPAWQTTRAELVPALKSDASLSPTHRRINLGHALVVVQVSLSLLLLVAAGLLVRTLRAAQRVDLGFDPSRVAIMSVDLTASRLRGERVTLMYRTLVDRLRQLPDVERVSLAPSVPLGPGFSRRGMVIEGREPEPGEDTEQHFNFVTPDYFDMLRIPIVRGRSFTDRDDSAAPGVVMVNEAFVRRFWPGADPIGKRISLSGSDGPWIDVVGVTKDGKYLSVTDETLPFVFLPMWQNTLGGVTVHVQTRSDRTAAVIKTARDAIHSVDPALPVFNEALLADQIGISLLPRRLAASWLGGFGAVALLLAAIGLYGVLAHAVSLRQREIGVRVALGAEPGAIQRLFVFQGLRVVLIGVVIGLAGALAMTRPLSALLYGVSPTDPATFVTMSALLFGVALVATYLPARRAARLDPVRLLRRD